jgi:hypothetical protein
MEIEFDLSDLKESAVRRMLMSAMKRESSRSKPAHKRDEDTQKEIEEEDEEENSKLADLHSDSKGEANPLPVTEEDMSEEAAEELKKKAKKKVTA